MNKLVELYPFSCSDAQVNCAYVCIFCLTQGEAYRYFSTCQRYYRWFYSFKLHLMVNYQGEIVAAKVSALWKSAMLSKRFIIETINDQLKNISYIEYSRHSRNNGFMLNLLAGLVADYSKKHKPSLNLTDVEHNAMVAA